METLSALLAICAGNSPVPGEFPTQRPVTRSFHVFFDLRLNKTLSKQSWGWWFETLSPPLWRHYNVLEQESLGLPRRFLRCFSLVSWLARVCRGQPKYIIEWQQQYCANVQIFAGVFAGAVHSRGTCIEKHNVIVWKWMTITPLVLPIGYNRESWNDLVRYVK